MQKNTWKSGKKKLSNLRSGGINTLERIQKAVIVAAGEGRRLRPLTFVTPKPLVSVNGTRLIDTSIQALKQNGIHDIYIVVGYKKEQFYEVYNNDPDIHILENPYYLQGNNVTSMYIARDYLPGSFVIEGDLLIRDQKIYDPMVEQSAYCATYMEHAPEWALKVQDGHIISCDIDGGDDAYRNLGISVWTKKDGALLSELLRKQFEEVKDWSVYWDQIPLSLFADQFQIGIREVGINGLTEIDTLQELIAIDPSYKQYQQVS